MVKPSSVVLAYFVLQFFFISTLLLIIDPFNQHFVYLANSFLHGKLYFLEKPGDWVDCVLYAGKVYWPLGPAPAILLMPFVWLGNIVGFRMYQGFMQVPLVLLTFIMACRLALRYKFSRQDACYLAFGFCFASVYSIVAYVPWVWQFIHAIVVFLLFVSITEWYGKKRYWIIGICFGIIVACRFTAAFSLLFFIGDVLWKPGGIKFAKVRGPLAQLILPTVLAALGLLWYNYARFGNPLENGYMLANNMVEFSMLKYQQAHYGLFKLQNIPTNIYYYFIKSVDPVRINHYGDFGQSYILKFPYVAINPPGVGFIVSSPIFLYSINAFRKKKLDRVTKLTIAPIIVIMSFLLTYYWAGWSQQGPRYLLDFLPLYYLVLLLSFKNHRISAFAKILIITSAIFNLYLLLT